MLPKELKDRLASEFRFAADGMAAAPDMDTKLYLFSTFFGESQRVLNLSWDSNLALLHLVTRSAYQELLNRVTQMASGVDRVIGMPKELPDALSSVCRDISALYARETFDEGRFRELLTRISDMAYVVTGNGHYLYLKGKIKIQ